MVKRTRHEIYADMLDVILRRRSSLLTRIAYGANLPVDRAKRFLRVLVGRGFVVEESYGGLKRYRVTEKGLEFLEAYKALRSFTAELDEVYE